MQDSAVGVVAVGFGVLVPVRFGQTLILPIPVITTDACVIPSQLPSFGPVDIFHLERTAGALRSFRIFLLKQTGVIVFLIRRV